MVAVSVILPVHGVEPYVDATIESIRNQVYSDFELLIIDDRAATDTAAVAARHAAEDPRIRVVPNRGTGLVSALSTGIECAAAQLIARIDADDIALPQRLERQLERFTAEPDLLLLGTAISWIDPLGQPVGVSTPPTDDAELKSVLLSRNPMAHPTVMMRRSALETAGGYREPFVFAEDYDLWLRIAEHGKIANLKEPLVRYRSGHRQFRDQKFEKGIMSEIAARVSAGLRRGGKPDPFDKTGTIDTAQLVSLGIDATAIDDELARRALHIARFQLKFGDKEGSRMALAFADRHSPTGAISRFRYRYRRARVFL